MTVIPPESEDLRAGRAALAEGAWEQARTCFERAIQRHPDPEAYEGLASARSMLAEGNGAIDARERAYELYVAAGRAVDAARTAIWLAVDSMEYRYEAAVATGWIRRADRLLETGPPTVERGLVRALEGHLALMAENDIETALARSAEGLEIARLTARPDLEVLSLGLSGLARVSQGDVKHGMQLLDEATAGALGGEVKDLAAIGQSCCYLIHACERVRDFDRAGQWCLRVREFCQRWRYTTMFTVCRTQYAAVLTYRGEWAAAEAELLAAVEELQATRPAAAAPGIVRLAELRRRQGRAQEAAALYESVKTHRMATLGRGELALEAGDPRGACDLADQFLRRIPRESRTERVAGLDLMARAAAAWKAQERVEAAATELEEIAGVIATDPLRATALLARGLALAAGDPEEARRRLEDAADLHERCSMPFEAAHARLALARVLAAAGRSDAARTECTRAAAIFERLGTQSSPRPAATTPGERPPLTARELEVLQCVAAGLADKEVAARLELSPHTVHRHIQNILTKLDLPSRSAAVAHATRLGLLK